jgi:hypothetical protein
MLDIQGRKYASVTVCDVTLYDLVTKYPVMFFDTLQVTSIDGSAETTDIQGGQGNATLASVSHSKTIDVQFDDAIMTMSSLALLTGGSLEQATDDDKITMTETELVEVKAGESKVTLSRPAKVGTYVWIAEMVNGILSTATRLEEKVAEEKKEFNFSEFHNGPEKEDGDAIYRVFYEWEMGFGEEEELSELSVLADKFAGTYRFIGDTLLFNQYTGLNDIFQIEIPKLKLDSTYSMSFNASTEAVVFSFKGKALRDDLGNMILFRQLKQDSKSGNETYGQFDGSYAQLPAVEVTIDEETGALSDTGREYPIKKDDAPSA